MIKSRLRDYAAHFTADFAASLVSHAPQSFFIVDQQVMSLYRRQLQPILPVDRLVLVEATEHHKTMAYCQDLIAELVARNIRRNHVLIAVGGGVIQDITAFIASIVFRGLTWVFYPTTLLAQADSCVGSKSSLNLGSYKNLLGTFNPPAQIWIDVAFLETLPETELKSGIGEILHFYLVDGHAKIQALVDHYEELLQQPRRLSEHIRAALEIKRRTVEVDEFDQHRRNLFNYGHTFGHAIETVTNYCVSHGQAVTMGMDIANYLSAESGLLPHDGFSEMHRILEKNLPALRFPLDRIGEYLAALSRDKKNTDGRLTCILTSGPGAMEKTQIPFDDRLKASLVAYFRTYASA